MELLVAPLFLICLVLYVAWPMLNETVEADVEERSELGLALEEKENALSNLKDIEMDYRMGKLSQTDYEKLRQEFEVRAVASLKKVESLQKKSKPRRKRS